MASEEDERKLLYSFESKELTDYELKTQGPSPPQPSGGSRSPARKKFGKEKSPLKKNRPKSKKSSETLELLKKTLAQDELLRPASITDAVPQTPENTYNPEGSNEASMELRTGEDVISFFGRNGSETPIKFVHLNRAETGKKFRPYDLVVTSARDVMAEYFTMSASGLVHVTPGMPSEFIPLSEWMRQSTMFNVISSIPFYKHYAVKKCMSAWRRNVRFKIYCQQRKKLSTSLFFGKESFCAPLLEVKRVMIDAQSVVLLDLKAQKTYECSAFVDYQATKRSEAAKQLDTCLEKLQMIVQRVCTNVSNLARNNDAYEDALQSQGLSARPDKNKSIVAAKMEQIEKRRLLKRAAEEAAMLCDFIRLVDYIDVENLVELTVKSCYEFLQELLKVPRKTGLFETTIQFDESVTLFSPTADQIQDMVVSMTDEMISTVNAVSRVLFIRPFAQYLSAHAITDGPHVGSTIRQNADFVQIRNDINEKIRDDYKEAEEYVKVFDNVRPIYEHDLTWNFDEYQAQKHTMATLKSDLAQMNAWDKELEKMRAGQTIGILHVESRKLKQALIPMTTSKMEAMKGLVRDLARVRCRDQLIEYKQRIQILVQRPQHLQDFATFVEKKQDLKTQYKALLKNANMVDEMYRLLNTYGVRISSEDMVQLDDLRSVQESYREEVDAAEDFIVERNAEMNEQLELKKTNLVEQVEQLHASLETGVFVDGENFDSPEVVLTELKAAKTRLDHFTELSKQYNEYEELFAQPNEGHSPLTAAIDYFTSVETLWTTVHEWNEKYSLVMTQDFKSVDVEELAKEVAVLFKDAYAMHKKLSNDVTSKLKDKTADFKLKMPVILEIGNPAMKDRHWERIFGILNQEYYAGKIFTLEDLIAHGIFEHAESLSEVSGTASGEAQIESSLDSIRDGWKEVIFTCLPHREQEDVFILGGLEDVLTLLEDNQVTLQTMMGSRYIMGVKDEVENWNKRLSLLGETLDEWVTAQRNWMYLETIFCAEDIQKQLPVEAQKFMIVDKNWKSTMIQTNANPAVLQCVENDGAFLEQFKVSNQLLDEIQKSLEDYLETKRMAFPRFYFLSNDELLEILSQTRDPRAVQPHLGKCFDAMKSIDFGTTMSVISAMVSGEGEKVQFVETVEAQGPVEMWLCRVEDAMRRCLYSEAKRALTDYPPHENAVDRSAWLFNYPAQDVILIDQVFWTQNVSKALRQIEDGSNPKAVKEFLEFSLQQIDSMVNLVRGELSKLQRILMGALITIDVHARDVVRSLVAQKISNLNDFEWTRQLRYYWDAEVDDCIARQTNTRFAYGYEYLGNSPRLVITPLTDVCYMTLTGALHLRLGGAPAGPAGTGKTETTKDLAKALAVPCVVFNCSDGLDFKMMGRFFSGLAQAGAWACFDEFNRIDIEVLSVIAQQILCIQQAIVSEVEQFEFEGKLIRLNMGFGVFITMNPGYAGRTELPDNLKALFRPVAMMVPDYRLIAEIVLFSEGFANALPLSNKMTQLYSLSSEQLSKQDHYDFGMRAVKSVLVAAGQLKRKEPGTHEDLLLIRAMRDSNVPKFLEEDLPLFRGIIADLFPGVDVPFVDYGVLQKAIEKQLEIAQLQQLPSFITKAIQVHETQLVRHGMMVVGEAGSGKSTICTILAKSLTQLYEENIVDRDGFYKIVNRLILNPKSITAGQLYGEFNLLTNEWTDGLVPKLVRQCVLDANESPNRKWIMFDGPVDAVWIENMNTVLDDNKTLCLANSERIKLPSTLHMMFEVQDLKVASPATVSRCGMVYMEQIHIGTLSLAYSWRTSVLDGLLPEYSDTIINLIETYVPEAIEFVRRKCHEKIASDDGSLMKNFLNLYTACIEPRSISGANPSNIGDLIQMFFVFALAWSVGANVDDASRDKFNAHCLQALMPIFSKCGTVENVYSFSVDVESCSWRSWNQLTPPFVYDPTSSYFTMVVPTLDTTRYRYLLDKLLLSNVHVLYMGETGVGKSVVVQSFLGEMARTDEYVSVSVGYSAQTTPQNLREILESKLEKKRKNLLGPPAGKHMLCFIDDLNMPALEIYGAQPPNELLRQIIDQGGFYDTGKLFFKQIKDVVFASACAPPGGGRNEVTPRLTRHFHMVWIPQLSSETMSHIFSSILSGFLDNQAPHLTCVAPQLVDASVALYQQVQVEMLPTPSKSHYTFNLRDLSKVFQGVLMGDQETLETQEGLVRLWLHEEARVFRDRLINDSDRTWFNGACSELLGKYLQLQWKPSAFESLVFGDYMTRQDKKYRQVEDLGLLSDLLTEYLEEYNITFPSQMNLVFFNDAIHHISRICRILRQPRGNALLVGVGGSGRQSLTRLACFMTDYQCCSIEITRGYGSTEFHEDLKVVLQTAGAENQKVAFLFSDAQIVTESFLEDLNNILNTGEVPNLFAPDEVEQIISSVRPLAEAAGKLGTREEILEHFVTLVRENLHIVLAVSPIGAGFRNRCRMFPSLVNCCTIDWFNAWPEDALYSVAHSFFAESAQDLGIESQVDRLCSMAVTLHRTVETATNHYFQQLSRRNYTTPTSYLELIRLYVDMLGKQRLIVQGKEARYRGGLDKLAETETVVANLKTELIQLQPVLVKSQEETAELLTQVSKDQKEADEQQVLVEADVTAANKIADEVKAIKDDCQKDLDQAMPAYYAAIKALSSLKKDDITILKTFTNPPRLVAVTLNAICLLFGSKQEWSEAKKLLNDMKFLEKLKDFDKDNIPPKTIRQLAKFMSDEEFTPENIQSISTAACSLCMWVRAMYTYDRVAKNIAPKKENLRVAEERLEREQAELKTKQDSLNLVLSKVAGLKATLEAAQQKKKDLEEQTEKTQAQLKRAKTLIDSLGEERGRWKECASNLALDLKNLIGDIILSAGCIAYLGPFTAEFRADLTKQWGSCCTDNHLPVTAAFSLEKILSDPVQVRDWNIKGLPADEFSTQNGLFATLGRRWPLMIDPQGQANKWIKNMYKEDNLQVIKLTEKDFLRTLENAIRYGAPVILENVEEELDPSLEPVLLKQVFKRAGQNLLHLGDSDIPYSDSFRFFITTKLANPHYMPEVCIKVTIINFTVTVRGLEDQLLVDVIRNERPDLEQKKDELTVTIAADEKQLKEIEDKILYMLENSQGNILDDEELISVLADSKVTSSAIKSRMAEAEVTSNEINSTREGYRCVAIRGSLIYFVIANLALIDPMYQYSLQYYQSLFNMRLEQSEPSDELAKRLDILMKDITTSMYVAICRGLFEKDKLVYSFMMAVSILRQTGAISPLEWKSYLVRPTVAEESIEKPSKLHALDDKAWESVVALKKIHSSFEPLIDAIVSNPEPWKHTMVDARNPFDQELPDGWEQKLSPFQKLLVLRGFRPEMTVFSTNKFVLTQMGVFFTESPPFDLEGCYQDSTPSVPLIFVLSPGADITDYLMDLAKAKDKEGLKIISLGQGQGPIAEALMEQGRTTGDWVCLQNCHLAVSWLGRLEQLLEQVDTTSLHPEYRLWLTSMPSDKFPVPILQNGIKITNEPPKGIKANLKRTFLDLKSEDYESCSKSLEFKKLLFALAFYNALCLERRKFGAVGWNIPYEWMNSDLKTGIQQVKLYLEEQDDVPYTTLNVMVADISYGGRITDRWDKRTNSSIMRKLFCPEILMDSYRFTDSPDYYAPPTGTLEETRDYVNGLPVVDTPGLFGLDQNADITYQQKNTSSLLDTIIKMEGSGGDSGAEVDSDTLVYDLASAIEARMPALFDLTTNVHPKTFEKTADGSMNSFGVFLSQETIRFNGLIKVMKHSLLMLKKAIKGLVVMSGPLEQMYNGFLLQRIPNEWETAGYPCLKPLGSWTEDFFRRIEFTQQWVRNGPPSAYWLSGFFFPQGFMTAVKQTYSRQHKIAIDTLKVGCQVLTIDYNPHERQQPEYGVYIFGLFLEAARFDRRREKIAESIPGVLFDSMPMIWLKPCLTSVPDDMTAYDCPLYKTSVRAGTLSTTGHSTNFVVALRLPSDKPPDYWIRRGCAMLCMLDT